jgi:hypothetical protein
VGERLEQEAKMRLEVVFELKEVRGPHAHTRASLRSGRF